MKNVRKPAVSFFDTSPDTIPEQRRDAPRRVWEHSNFDSRGNVHLYRNIVTRGKSCLDTRVCQKLLSISD